MAAFSGFEKYLETIDRLLLRVSSGDAIAGDDPGTAAHLDGLANREFRRLVNLETRRSAGTFFSSSALRTRALEPHREILAAGEHILDPACGIGDLLLAAVALTPAAWPPYKRATHAAAHVHGRDILGTLTDVASRRLALWAISQGARDLAPDSFNITQGDAFADDVPWDKYALILLNPPYTATKLSPGAGWASGRVTAAAPFTLEVLQRARPGAKLVAILPDVLRTGTRYAKWRNEIEKSATIEGIDIYGRFDPWTDIDVFIAHLNKVADGDLTPPPPRIDSPAPPPTGWQSALPEGPSLANIADINVGDVVPHRHIPSGSLVPYLTVEGAPVGEVITEATQQIRYSGRLHSPPFILVRRTSAPARAGSTPRVRPAIYNGAMPAAVENHLLVIKPHLATLAKCEELADRLRSPIITEWLDTRLRLRHLTVAALREVPQHLIDQASGND